MTKTTMEKPSAVIFDWDNTLIDSWPVIHGALNKTLDAFGLDTWTIEETKSRVAKSMRDSFPELFGDRWQDAGENFYMHYTALHLENLTPLAGAEDLLVELHAQGMYLAVVSNKNGDILREEADHLGWSKYFGKIVGAMDAPMDKPAPDPVHLALSASQTLNAGRHIWFVGDARIDMECAANAGCTGVLVREKTPENSEFEPAIPALHVKSCLALSNAIKNM